MKTIKHYKTGFPTFSNLLDELLTTDTINGINKAFTQSNPSANIKENNEQFTIELAAPGLKREDFKIDLDENTLSIGTEIKGEKNEENEKFTRREFSYQSFKRTFTLPENVKKEEISATYNSGILHITIPKVEVVQNTKRLIEVS